MAQKRLSIFLCDVQNRVQIFVNCFTFQLKLSESEIKSNDVLYTSRCFHSLMCFLPETHKLDYFCVEQVIL